MTDQDWQTQNSSSHISRHIHCVTIATWLRQSSLWLHSTSGCCYRAPARVSQPMLGFSLGSPYTVRCCAATIVKAESTNAQETVDKDFCRQILRHFTGSCKDFDLHNCPRITCPTVKEAFHSQQVYLCAAPALFVLKLTFWAGSAVDYKHQTF